MRPTLAPDLIDLFFDAAGVGLCLLDARGLVRRANGAWLKAAGLISGAAIGRDIWELFPATPPELRRLHDEVRAGKPVESPSRPRRSSRG